MTFLLAVIWSGVISSFDPPTSSTIFVGDEIEIAWSPSVFIFTTALPAWISTAFGLSSAIPLGSSAV